MSNADITCHYELLCMNIGLELIGLSTRHFVDINDYCKKQSNSKQKHLVSLHIITLKLYFNFFDFIYKND